MPAGFCRRRRAARGRKCHRLRRATGEYSPEEAAKLPPPPAGSKYVTLNHGSVLWSQWSNHEKGGPMLMPADVSLEENAKRGEKIFAEYLAEIEERDISAAEGMRRSTMV